LKAVAEPGSGLRNAPFADTSVEELDPEVRDAPRPVSPAHARRTLAGRVTTAALGCNLPTRRVLDKRNSSRKAPRSCLLVFSFGGALARLESTSRRNRVFLRADPRFLQTLSPVTRNP
jgi:hypothetical protein